MRRLLLIPVLLFLLFPISSNGKDIKVRMAYLQSDIHHLPLWVGLEKGYFKKLGVNLEIAGVFKAGPEIMSAFGAKELDMAYVGEAPSTTAVANGMAKVVAIAQVNTEGSALVVKPNISSLKSLRSKRVAIPGYSTVQDFLLRRTLKKNNIGFSELKILVVKPPEMTPTLKRGDIDGFIAWEPYPSNAILSNAGRVLLTSHEMWPNHPCCVLVSSKSFLKKHREIVKKVLRAHIMAIDFIHKHPEEAIKIGVKYTGFSKSTVKTAMKTVNYTYRLSVDGEREYVNFLKSFGYIKIKNVDNFIKNFLNPLY